MASSLLCPDGSTPALRTFFRDFDLDGFGDGALTVTALCPPVGFVSNATDCAPDNAAVYPGAMETACTPQLDEDCDGDALEECGSCQQLAAAGVTQNGVYNLHLDGEPQTTRVSCVMDGGLGYTLIQRTVWNWSATRELLTDTASFMSQSFGAPNEGVYRLAGRHWPALHTSGVIRVEAWPRVLTPITQERCGPISFVEPTGSMTLINGLPALPATTTLFIGRRVSTLNQDQDDHPQSCVSFNAVPFFYGSCCFTCPSFGASYWPGGFGHPMMHHTLIQNRLAPACSGTTVAVTPSALDPQRFIGLDTLEIYLR